MLTKILSFNKAVICGIETHKFIITMSKTARANRALCFSKAIHRAGKLTWLGGMCFPLRGSARQCQNCKPHSQDLPCLQNRQQWEKIERHTLCFESELSLLTQQIQYKIWLIPTFMSKEKIQNITRQLAKMIFSLENLQ